jgi:hypothetical protein
MSLTRTVIENVNIVIPSFMQNNLIPPVHRLSYTWTVQNTGMQNGISVTSYRRVQLEITKNVTLRSNIWIDCFGCDLGSFSLRYCTRGKLQPQYGTQPSCC